MRLESAGAGVLRGTLDATQDEVLSRWAEERAFALAFSEAIAGAPFQGLYFETPPLTAETLSRRFECVLVDGAALVGMRADPAPFGDELAGNSPVVTFENLRGDAVLVAPTPAEGVDAAHLAVFLRTARDDQKVALWRAVALAVRSVVGERPRWLSTAGLGVAWLHVRLDTRPKYYRYGPYQRLGA